MSEKENSEKIYINVAQAYLETARSFHNCELNYTNNNSKKAIIQLEYFLVAMTIINSFLAVDSFFTLQLYLIWEHAKITKETFDKEPGLKDYKMMFDSFIKKYGNFNDFKQLKNTDLSNIKIKIKTVCENYNIEDIRKAKK
jgi:hypothetical protein